MDESLPDDSLVDVDSELPSDGVLPESLETDCDESLDDPESLDLESDESLDDDAPDDEVDPDRLGKLIEVLESLDPLSEDSLDCESDELFDEPLDADDEPSELDELLTLGILVDVLELLDSLLPDESLD